MPEQITVHTIRPSDWNNVAAFLTALRERFTHFGTGVTFIPGQTQMVADGSLDAVRTDGCAGAATNQVVSLFARFASTFGGPGQIAVFFARQLADATGPTSSTGCANHPNGHPGVIVRCDSRPLTLAHEVCHLFGLDHVSDPSNANLMIAVPENIIGNGTLIPAQVDAIRVGLPAAAAFEMAAPVQHHKVQVTRARKRRKQQPTAARQNERRTRPRHKARVAKRRSPRSGRSKK